MTPPGRETKLVPSNPGSSALLGHRRAPARPSPTVRNDGTNADFRAANWTRVACTSTSDARSADDVDHDATVIIEAGCPRHVHAMSVAMQGIVVSQLLGLL